jgi:murein DD-endopeptidase
MTKLPRNYCLVALLPICLVQLAACSWQNQAPVSADDAPVRISPTSDADGAAVPSRVARTAAQMTGVPYRYGGFTPKGFDCSGLVYYSYRKAGLTVPRTSGEQFKTAKRIDLDDARPGDLLFFARGRSVDHVAIYLGDHQFVHAPSTGKSVSVASMNDPYYREHFVAAARFTVRDWAR